VTTPEPPPEARLIARLRREMVPPVSLREAARRAGFSVATWTHNEQGWRKVTPAMIIPITATDDKLARMALVVGATPEQLREAGRDEAGRMLQKLIDAGPDPAGQMVARIRESRDFTEAQKQALIGMVRREET
jgi:hypothetical protein